MGSREPSVKSCVPRRGDGYCDCMCHRAIGGMTVSHVVACCNPTFILDDVVVNEIVDSTDEPVPEEPE